MEVTEARITSKRKVTNPMDYNIRSIEQQDIPFLWEMLYQSMFVPEGQMPFPRSITDEPFISKYVDGWGETISDIGLIAEKNYKKIGAIWVRLFDEAHKGFGYVDDETPEITIALLEEFRGKGIGTALMLELENQAKNYGYQKLCLSVDPRNSARRLYERFGYVHIGWCDTSWTMEKIV